MSTEQDQICITVKAEGDLSSYQYRFVKVTNSGYGTIPANDGTTQHIIGVLQNKPSAYGRDAKVCVAGHTKVLAGAAISSIGFIGHLNAGYAQAVSTQGYYIYGRNITTTAGSGEYVEMILSSCIFQ